MGDRVKGIHDGPRVPRIYDQFSYARGNLFNELLIPSASMLEVTEMVVCSTFIIHMPDESLLNLGHPRDNHVKYDLSHFINPPRIVADH